MAIVDIDDDNGKRVANDIQSSGGKVSFHLMDVSEESEVKRVFADIYSDYGRLHILVNNAGVASPRKAAHETTIEEWDKIMDVNLKGAFLCTKYAVPYILETGPGSVYRVVESAPTRHIRSGRLADDGGRSPADEAGVPQ